MKNNKTPGNDNTLVNRLKNESEMLSRVFFMLNMERRANTGLLEEK